VDPLDALQVINHLNASGPGQLALSGPQADVQPPLLDVDGDGQVLPQDVLLVINYLNRTNNSSEGEGDETSGGNPPAWLLARPAMTPAVVPGGFVAIVRINPACQEPRSADVPQFVAQPMPRKQVANSRTVRPSAANATEQADLADELTMLGSAAYPWHCVAVAEGWFEDA
jgi:hypothetical protein